MTRNTFLDRNKKKSLLAALLLFLRQRKILVLLLLLVLVASTVFVSPSSWVTGLPGGARFAAGVAWVAGKLGIDVSRWGLGRSKNSYADLLEAFREARLAGKAGAAGGVGWGPFFGHGGGAGGGAGAGPGSLDYVKGSKADLDHGVVADGATGEPHGIAAVVDPADSRNKAEDGVQIADGDLTGQREGFLKEAFAGGFMNGLLGGAGTGGDGALSGGAYAGQGFFSGKGGAAGASNGLAKGALANMSSIPTPSGVKGARARGALSALASRAVEARAMKGVAGANSLGNLAFSQLAEGKARADLGTQYCKPPECPGEFAATNTGAIYDGNNISSGFLTSSDPGASGVGFGPTTVVPPDNTGGIGGGGAAGDAQNYQTCADAMQTCAASKTAPMQQEGKDETQLSDWFSQMAGACGDPCNCGPCNDLKGKISGLCNGDMATQISLADAPCAPLPDYCAALGFTNQDPSSSNNTSGQNLCKQDVGQCGCSSFLCSLGCLLGS